MFVSVVPRPYFLRGGAYRLEIISAPLEENGLGTRLYVYSAVQILKILVPGESK